MPQKTASSLFSNLSQFDRLPQKSQKNPTTPAGPTKHRFPQPVLLQNRSKNGAVSGAEVPGLVPFSFPRIVTEAERQGCEPWVPVRALRFSRPVWI